LVADVKQQTDKVRAAVAGRAPEADDPVAGAGEPLKYDPDPDVVQLLKQVVEFRLGQTIDEVRGDAVILSGIAQPVIHIQAVCVKFIFIKKLLEGHDDLGDVISKM